MTIFSSIVDRLLRKETVLTANFGAIGDTGSQFVQQTVLVNPDGPDAAELIKEMTSALRLIQRDIRADDLLAFDPELGGHADAIDTLLRNTGL